MTDPYNSTSGTASTSDMRVEDKSEVIKEEVKSEDKVLSDEVVFKKPAFIGKFPKLSRQSKKSQPSADIIKVDTSSEKEEIKDEVPVPKPVYVKKSPAEQISEKTSAIPYKEPPWSGLPRHEYHLEVLKGGIIAKTIPLTKPYIVIGRFSQCDIMMEHPSISRYHCVLQYRSSATPEEPCGFYIYDLGSTHGSFLNRLQLQPKCYQRVHVGHFIKIGGSSRVYILQGPESDEEPESDLSAKELMETASKRSTKDSKSSKDSSTTKENSESDGISWGMGEDASEVAEDSDGEGEMDFVVPEELYLDDPKKTLRGWFEREGYDLPNYEATEAGPGRFTCKVELPIESSDGKSVIAFVEHQGKKKDTVVQCALEACRILNKHGVLRQAKHESHKKKKKDWSENDYYDSDEDDYLDRTGDVQKKRVKRMKEDGADDAPVMTYEYLKGEYDKVINELTLLEKRLSGIDRLKQQQQDASEERQYTQGTAADELDAFMERLKSQVPDKHKRVSWKLRVVELKKEELRLRKLVNIARPSLHPELQPYSNDPDIESQHPRLNANKLNISAKSLLKKYQPQKPTQLNQPRILGTHKAFIEDEPEQKLKLSRLTDPDYIQPVPYTKPEETTSSSSGIKSRPVEISQLMGPYRPKSSIFNYKKSTVENNTSEVQTKDLREEQDLVIKKTDHIESDLTVVNIPANKFVIMEEPDPHSKTHEDNCKVTCKVIDQKNTLQEEDKLKLKNKMGPTLPTLFFDKRKKVPQKTLDGLQTKKEKPAYKVVDTSYETWTPPADQSGDGRTKLNEKYGY